MVRLKFYLHFQILILLESQVLDIKSYGQLLQKDQMLMSEEYLQIKKSTPNQIVIYSASL